VVGLQFGLTSNHFMWIWVDLGHPWHSLGTLVTLGEQGRGLVHVGALMLRRNGRSRIFLQ